MTTNMTLRLPDDLAALIDQAANESGQSRTACILQILTEATARNDEIEATINLGYVELCSGELGPDATCPECGGPLENVHIGFLAGRHRPIPFGPVCGHCATTE